MSRPSTKADVENRLRTYLTIAEKCSPDTHPLDIMSVARTIGVCRGTLRNHSLIGEVKQAQKRQQAWLKETGREQGTKMLRETIEQLRGELAKLQKRYENLLVERCIIEANVVRLNVDMRELLKPLSTPDRRAPRSRKHNHMYRRG